MFKKCDLLSYSVQNSANAISSLSPTKEKPRQQNFMDNSRNAVEFLPYKNQQILVEILEKLSIKGLNYEILFRCIDFNDSFSIAMQDMKNFFMQMNLSIPEKQILLAVNIIDENCRDQITFQEYSQLLYVQT